MYELKKGDYKKLARIIKKDFQIICKSPYSNSFYNSNDISWGHKPESSMRISDHWNFNGRCPTHNVVDNDTHLSVGIFEDGKYRIIESFEILGTTPNGDFKFNTLNFRNGEFIEAIKEAELAHFEFTDTNSTDMHFDGIDFNPLSEVMFYSESEMKRDCIKKYRRIEFEHVKFDIENITKENITKENIRVFVRDIEGKLYDQALADKVRKILQDKRTKVKTKTNKLIALGAVVKNYRNGVEI